MVDFTKRLGKRELSTPLDPLAIYDTLDRASDKGELRPIQTEILQAWHADFRSKRDIVIKLHTGQGKTLIGLLTLQSKLNEGAGPAIYLCPNNYLVEQTCSQAAQFGVRHCKADAGIPQDFLDSKSILITSVQKLFNGRTKFGIGQKSTTIGTVVMDDCHACIDSIRDAFTVRFAREEPQYQQIRDLFGSALENQGAGTFSDLCNGEESAVLPVSYWDWKDRASEVVSILSKRVAEESQKTTNDSTKRVSRHDVWFVWPLIKDIIENCFCVISGRSLDIVPYMPPLDLFGSYHRASHRVFMSATITDDSFLVKGLRLPAETIRNPLVSKQERWSGEKMILIPSLIHESLDRSLIAKELGKPRTGRNHGVVALVPSFAGSKDWEAYGANVANTSNIGMQIDFLKSKQFERPLVIVNRYDGIDLPDDVCRVLIFDSKPYSESLADRYEEQCRPNSEVTATRLARIIEQGLGRSVRGQKDYSVIVIIGAELVKAVRSQASRKYFSAQTQAQIELGLEVADYATKEIKTGETPLAAFNGLIDQCLGRDAGWKAYYVEKMNAVNFERPTGKVLEIYKAELDAEVASQSGDMDGAVKCIQSLIDGFIRDEEERGWYLQQMARYLWSSNKIESNQYQLEAHKKNRYLLKPRTGTQVTRMHMVSQKRVDHVLSWVTSHGTYEQLNLSVQDILARLDFGVKADRFEQALKELGLALGFVSGRPDKEWKAGPDNLWGIEDGHFVVIECKSEVAKDRAEINKTETGQMNNSCAWFRTNYPGASVTNIMVIPAGKIGKAGGFNELVQIMREKELRKLRRNVQLFFTEFQKLDFKSLSEAGVQQLLEAHKLTAQDVKQEYGVEPRQL